MEIQISKSPEQSMITLYHQDILETTRDIQDDSVDHINVDPPYNIGFDGGKGWDNIANYLDWCQLWINECARILKPDRMIGIWGTLKDRQFLDLIRIVDATGLTPQNEIIWSYNWGGRRKTNFARKHEYCFFWSKGESFLFDDQAIRIERKVVKNIRTGEPFAEGTIPTCVWEKNNHTTSADFCNWHPTTKNIDILMRMILAYTNPNDTVFDGFSGSGSTAIACIRTGRHFLGCELDKDYYVKSLERIGKEETHI